MFVALCVAVGLFAASSGVLAATIAASTFDTSDEGWQVVELDFWALGNPPAIADPSHSPDWHPAGGNPGGYLSSTDQDPNGWYQFSAPSKFLGDKSQAYGGRLSFDLTETATSEDNSGYGLILAGGGETLYQTGMVMPSTTGWSHYDVPLQEGSSWRLNSEFGVQATSTDFQSVLDSLTAVYILGDWNSGPDTCSVDNVAMTTVPEPSTFIIWSLLGSLGIVIGWRRRKRAA
jgi:hypothetical protein